ncbi:MAG: M24 family metallopeptidase [Candidatus Hadarchaeum sp.]|uniref:M24 family metallopeptidase n=1 Tax=Candidatus Hadarchaeum sp. TaxID=2883567 RepID=UPI00317351C7
MSESILKTKVLSIREQSEVIYRIIKKRINTLLPVFMEDTGYDCWLILCYEDNPDPVLFTLVPLNTWTPILQILAFFNRKTKIIGYNISGMETYDLYDRPYRGQDETTQWEKLKQLISEYAPKRIGINIGHTIWAASGLSYALYTKLCEVLPTMYVKRLVSAEPLVTLWASTLIEEEMDLYPHVVQVGVMLIEECFSKIVPHITTVDDLTWHYYQLCADLGIQPGFKPTFRILRRPERIKQYGEDDHVIRPGDLIHCDVGIKYLRLHTDHQRWAYMRETTTGFSILEELSNLYKAANQLQDIFLEELRLGSTGNEILSSVLSRARKEGLPSPKVYSHSLGYFLHEPGPLIGLPWEQNQCPGRGDIVLGDNTAVSMELSVAESIKYFKNKELVLSLEEDVLIRGGRAQIMVSRQRAPYIVEG